MARRKNSKVAERATCIVASILGAVAGSKGVAFLNEQGFMQSEKKLNLKKAASSGGLMLATAGGALMVQNPIASNFLLGLAGGSAIELTDDVVLPAVGLGGLGTDNVDELLDQFVADEDEEVFDQTGESIQLSGSHDAVKLA